MSFFKRHTKGLLLLLVIACGIIITSPYFNFQDYLSTGDQGRDLYAAQAVYQGQLPYKDFWWVYGPLTPYYYGLFFKIWGIKIASMILGKLVLKILGGVLIYLGMMEISSGPAACLAAIWYILFAQDFFFTYNHIAGVAMTLGAVFCLLSYVQRNRAHALWGALVFIFILCLIKVNFGLAALAGCLITVAVHDRGRRIPWSTSKKLFYAVSIVVIPIFIFFIYWSLLKNLSVMEIRQCLPYKEGDQPYSVNPWTAIYNFYKVIFRNIFSNWANFSFAVIAIASGGRTFYLFAANKLPSGRKIILGFSLFILALFYLANFHEYLKSGVWYRGFWAQPLSMMITFLLIDTATRSVPKIIRLSVFTFLGFLAMISWCFTVPGINGFKTPSHYLALPRGGIYLANSPSWIATVEQTTDFLNKTLKPNELFFALPYDCLYYYLTGKKTPTRQLIFFEHIKIPQEQEKSVIAELEKNHVHYILLSNRAFALKEPGLGLLGKTYCPLIGKYIEDNYVPIARFGDWKDEAGWGWNHGTLILKHK